jgi:hypothetical protein
MPSAVTPRAPIIEFAFTARVTLESAVVVGEGPAGLRRYVPITGGTVSGPLLEGSVLAAGGDWQVMRADGVLELEARYVIRAADGVMIGVCNRGLRCGPEEVMARLAHDEPVAASAYYFRTSAQFEAPLDSAHDWLNKALFIGDAEREPNEVMVHFHRIL